ncbi:septum formation protein Maf [Candidatus Sumerlaeota bacterium]|nr:septum formation protein Maf [Candidatus Sumerlaeota bacterium]
MNQNDARKPLILASASPRRRDLLEQLGIPFEIVPSAVDESDLQAPTPREFAILAAREKCLDVARRVARDAVVLAADTIVCVPEADAGEEIVLGKPSGPEEAREMLRRLSGIAHRVITGMAVRAGGGEVLTGAEETRVTFRCLSDTEIADYVATGEPLDKAGSYGAQGLGVRLIESVDGDFSNVIGLPMDLTRSLLRQDYPQVGRDAQS